MKYIIVVLVCYFSGVCQYGISYEEFEIEDCREKAKELGEATFEMLIGQGVLAHVRAWCQPVGEESKRDAKWKRSGTW